MEAIIASIVASTVSGLIVGAILAFVVNRQTKKQDAKEEARTAFLVSVLDINNASLCLSQAMAAELLENGRCNGKTTKALEYATDVRHKQEEQLRKNAAANF